MSLPYAGAGPIQLEMAVKGLIHIDNVLALNLQNVRTLFWGLLTVELPPSMSEPSDGGQQV